MAFIAAISIAEHVSGYAEPSDACPNATDHGTQHVNEHNGNLLQTNRICFICLAESQLVQLTPSTIVLMEWYPYHSKSLNACPLLLHSWSVSLEPTNIAHDAS